MKFEVCFPKNETTRSKMADMLTYKEPIPKKNSKEIDAQVKPNNEVDIILKDVEGVFYFMVPLNQKQR